MTAYGSDEAIERLEAAWTCEHLACMEMRGERDRARAVAVALEQEVSALRLLLHAFHVGGNPALGTVGMWHAVDLAIMGYAETGTLSADALALASRLSGGEG